MPKEKTTKSKPKETADDSVEMKAMSDRMTKLEEKLDQCVTALNETLARNLYNEMNSAPRSMSFDELFRNYNKPGQPLPFGIPTFTNLMKNTKQFDNSSYELKSHHPIHMRYAPEMILKTGAELEAYIEKLRRDMYNAKENENNNTVFNGLTLEQWISLTTDLSEENNIYQFEFSNRNDFADFEPKRTGRLKTVLIGITEVLFVDENGKSWNHCRLVREPMMWQPWFPETNSPMPVPGDELLLVKTCKGLFQKSVALDFIWGCSTCRNHKRTIYEMFPVSTAKSVRSFMILKSNIIR